MWHLKYSYRNLQNSTKSYRRRQSVKLEKYVAFETHTDLGIEPGLEASGSRNWGCRTVLIHGRSD